MGAYFLCRMVGAKFSFHFVLSYGKIYIVKGKKPYDACGKS